MLLLVRCIEESQQIIPECTASCSNAPHGVTHERAVATKDLGHGTTPVMTLTRTRPGMMQGQRALSRAASSTEVQNPTFASSFASQNPRIHKAAAPVKRAQLCQCRRINRASFLSDLGRRDTNIRIQAVYVPGRGIDLLMAVSQGQQRQRYTQPMEEIKILLFKFKILGTLNSPSWQARHEGL